MARVIVVGAGVIGLSCATRLLEAGHEVDVLARDLPLETTSVVAAALWYPYLAYPRDRVRAWSATAYAEFARLAEHEQTGVRMLPGTEVHHAPMPDPWWQDAVPQLSRVTAAGYRDAWSFVAPVIDMPVYLRWLAGRVRELGGTLTRTALTQLPERSPALILNCAGLGARWLVDDPQVEPVRGQVVLVEQVGLRHWWLDEEAMTYVIPRLDTIVVGGTEQRGRAELRPDPATAAETVRRASLLVPELKGAAVLGHRVGLRPARGEVRLERVGATIHCYGHGGAGVTMSWGCAEEVAALAARA